MCSVLRWRRSVLSFFSRKPTTLKNQKNQSRNTNALVTKINQRRRLSLRLFVHDDIDAFPSRERDHVRFRSEINPSHRHYLYARFDDDLFLFCGVSVTPTEVDSLLCFIKMEKNAFTPKITDRVLSFFFFLVVVFWLLFASELFSLSLSLSLSLHFSSYTQKQQYAYYNVF